MGNATFAAANKTEENITVDGQTQVKSEIEQYISQVPCDPEVSDFLSNGTVRKIRSLFLSNIASYQEGKTSNFNDESVK